MVAQRGDRQALVHVLPDAVRRLDRERQARDDTQRAQRDHRPGERVAVRLAAERDELAVGADQLHRHDGGGQVPQPVARPVRRGRAGAGHRDVGQGCQVVEREAGSFEHGPQVAVPDRAVDRDRARRGVDVDHPRQPGQREVVAVRVREPVEGVTRPDHAEGGRRPDRVLDGLDRRRLEQAPRVVLEVARPVPHAPRLPVSAAGTVKP